ncbi:MAG TPA: DUF58 domain-containing protein [Thermoplasmata archaeon]|nr:DUF58 domain-containing protein [Thermoplasmata archaeon]
MIARRGWLALLACAAAIVLALYTLDLLLLVATAAIFAVVAGEILWFHLAPAPDRKGAFRITRHQLPRVLSPGARAPVELEVAYHGATPLRAEVRDLVPGSLPAVSGTTVSRRWWWPGDRARLRYTTRAGARGSHVVGPAVVIVESSHGLAWEEWAVDGTEVPVKVVPPAPIERAYRIGPALFTRMQGRLALRTRGYGSEFRSLRPYQLSDDIRHVAWKRSRPGQLFVREFEQESRQDFVLLVDISPAMVVGIPGENALDRAIEASSLVTAAVARSGEDRVGLMTQIERPRQFLKPSRGAHHFRLIAENLAYLRAVEGEFDLSNALELLTRRLTKSTHVLVFSALGGPLDRLHLSHARFRARGHHLYVFPANAQEFYPPLAEGHPGAAPLRWAETEERAALERKMSEIRGEGVPVFPYDRRGATTQVLSTYGQLRAWGMA